MTGNDFLQQLAQHLQCLPEEERANAMAYYQEYLEEAGENEAEAVEHLGSPQSVAERIIKDLGITPSSNVKPKSQAAQYSVPPMTQNNSDSSPDTGRIILAVVLLVITFPFWIAIPIVWFTIALCLPIIPISLFCAGIVSLVQAIYDFTMGMASVGIFDLGVSLAIIGLFLLLWYPCFMGAWGMVKLFGKLCSSLFGFMIGKEREK